MRSLALLFGLVTVLVSSVNAAALPPRAITLHAEAHPVEHHLAKRVFSPNQLWNETGPEARDVRQKIILDCWWKAAEAVIAHVSPQWIENLFIDPATNQKYVKQGITQPQADFPIVKLWDPNTLKAKLFKTSIHNRSQTEDKGMGGFFWPDALGQALGQLGQQTNIPGVDNTTGITGRREDAFEQPLSILTGYNAVARNFSTYTNTDGTDYELWTHFRYCNSTPVMFNTLNVTKVTGEHQFGDHHVYPVIDAQWASDGQRWVTVRNVWGKTEWFKFEDVKANGLSTLYLRDWNKLQWLDSWG